MLGLMSRRGRLALPRNTLRSRPCPLCQPTADRHYAGYFDEGRSSGLSQIPKILVKLAAGIELGFTPTQTTVIAGRASPLSWQDGTTLLFLRWSSAAPAVVNRTTGRAKPPAPPSYVRDPTSAGWELSADAACQVRARSRQPQASLPRRRAPRKPVPGRRHSSEIRTGRQRGRGATA